MHLRDYLVREAQRITDGALSPYTDAEAWRRLLPERRARYREMMEVAPLPPPEQRTAPAVHVTGIVQRPRYRIEKLYYESLPGLYVTANLYVPGETTGSAPGVLYLCGHAPKQKVHYQAHPRRFAELGFVCLLVETVQLGESPGYHHGCYREGWFHWYSRGYTPAGIELLNGIRGLDLLAGRPEVDETRLGVTGISGGGAASWWIAAGDERVRAAAPVCATATLHSHVHDRTVDGHCDCMWWINTGRWDLADVGALIAPRPLLIASADRDAINTIASIRQVHRQLQDLYALLDAPDHLRLVETPGPHSYHERSRTAIFSWFLRHLQGQDVPPEQAGDIETSLDAQESEETLRVFVNGSPAENRTPTIHDELFTPPHLPPVADRAALEETRRAVIAALRGTTFGAFPATLPLDVEVEMEFANRPAGAGVTGCRFAFTSEEGWRLRGQLFLPGSASPPTPTVVALRSPGEERGATETFVGQVREPWARVVVEPRGTGETAWGEELQWHLRRAASWTGRTIASLRVWDTLRALEAVRSLPQVDGDTVALAARGEMAAVALYAALLDGRVRTVLLEAPPATQNASSRPDGRGPAIEMLSCLRVVDLPHVAGLLYPAEIAFVGGDAPTYAWAEELYRTLGPPGKLHRIGDLTAWRAARAAQKGA